MCLLSSSEGSPAAQSRLSTGLQGKSVRSVMNGVEDL